jgi:hypothetical protein
MSNPFLNAVDLIGQQRLRQFDAGHTRWRDSRHTHGELVLAAEAYIDMALGPRRRPTRPWPWADTLPKQEESTVARLVHAAALLAAEVDRRLGEGETP